MTRKIAGLRHPNLPLLLLQGRERVIGHFRPLLNLHEVTEQQWRIIRVLLERGPLEPRQIGELCGISSPSLAGVLERMEQEGLITKRRLEHDQRRLHVSLTSRAKRLAVKLSPAINEVYERIKVQLGSELWIRVQQTLEDLLRVLPVASVEASPAEADISAELKTSPLACK